MSKAGDYLDRCGDAERIRPKFAAEIGSKFDAEITHQGEIVITKEDVKIIMTIDEARRFVKWILKMFTDE